MSSVFCPHGDGVRFQTTSLHRRPHEVAAHGFTGVTFGRLASVLHFYTTYFFFSNVCGDFEFGDTDMHLAEFEPGAELNPPVCVCVELMISC